MIPFAPNDKPAVGDMFRRVVALLLLIFLLLVICIPFVTVYGGTPFATYEEAIRYSVGVIWKSLTSGNVMLLPIKLIFLPFLLWQNCSRPGCEWVGLLLIVVYYTSWFYVTILLKHKVFQKGTN